jgi:glucose repression mediator protein
MSQQKYPKAYEAYQQAVYRDGRNPTFWCSIGVLYYQINQYRDALDAYSRAIRLNPYISEVWYDLGTLYESCNNQTADALDAYGRAADLDPTNVHIKARLQLLQGQAQGQTQANAPAPVPQDVHPQAYQAPGVGAPPAPQWGAPAPTGGPPPQPPAPPRQIADWNRGLNDLQSQPPPPPPQLSSNAYDQRDALRGPLPGQHPSPRQEPPRSFPDPRGQPQPPRSPKAGGLPAPGGYPPGHTLPQLAPPQPQHDRAPNGAVFRGPGAAGPGGPPGPNGAPTAGGALPPYHRPFTPPTEIRPIRDERPPSPGSAYPHQQFHHGPSMQGPGGTGIAGGAPAPASALSAAEAAAREREDRPTSAMKRGREWDGVESGPAKKIANEENRLRQDDQLNRRVTPPSEMHRRNSSEARREEQRRANENYHPSEAAHHPPTLPSLQHMQQPSSSSIPALSDGPQSTSNPPSAGPGGPSPIKEEASRKDQAPLHEPAARQMDVDEDYDDEGDDEKRAGTGPKGSPRGNSANGSSSSNGNPASQAKAESAS